MPRGQPKVRKAVVTADTTLVTTAETVVATLAGVTTDNPQEIVKLRGWAQITSGSGVTGLVFRSRRGTDATGTLVGEGNNVGGGIAASTTCQGSIDTSDQPGAVAGQSYVLTVVQTAATGNGSAIQASLEAIIS